MVTKLILYKVKYSYSIILKRCEKYGLNIFTYKINDMINKKLKKLYSLHLTQEKIKHVHQRNSLIILLKF